MSPTLQVIICFFSLCALFLLWCYPWAHIEGSRIEQDRKTWTLIMNKSSGIENVSYCTLSVTNESGSLVEDYFKESDDLVMRFDIKFDNQSHVNTSTMDDVILPLRWIWIYGNGLDYLKWPQEYAIWSFGLLDFDTIAHIPLNLTASPRSCMLHYGDPKTTFIIATALNNMVKTVMHPKTKHYKGSRFCYSKIVKDIHANILIRNFAYFVGVIGRVCCNVSKDGQVTCSEQAIKTDWFYINFPFSLAFCVLIFSPLLFSCIKDWLWPPNIIVQHQHNRRAGDYTNIETAWVFLEKKSPITFLSIISSASTVYCSQRVSKVFGFLLKVVIICVFPVGIYSKLLLYKKLFPIHEFLNDKMQHNLPVEFYSVLFGWDKQSKNFLTLTGGPYVLFILFFIIGIVGLIVEMIICDHEDVKQKVASWVGLKDDQCESVSSTIKNYFWKIFTKAFWKDSFVNVPKYEAVYNIFIFIFVYLCPLMFAFRLILARIMFLVDHCFRNRIVFSLLTLFAGLAYVYVLFAYCSIFISSFEFLTLLGTFLYVAVVKYPEVTGGYVSISVGVAIIIVSSLRYPARRYLRFLHLVTKVFKTIGNVEITYAVEDNILHLIYFEPKRIKQYSFTNVQNENSSECVLINNTLVVSHVANITSFCINGINVKLTENTTPPHTPHIKYKNGQLGVKKDLFLKLVNELRPTELTMARVILETLGSSVLFAWTANLINQLHQSSHISAISNVIMAYVIVKIPELVKLLVSEVDLETKTTILEEQIRYEVLKEKERE